MKKTQTIVVQGHPILVGQVEDSQYVNLSQLAEASTKEGQDPSQLIANWLRIGNTIEFLALWEKLYGAKEDFSDDGYQQIILESLDNGFSLSAQRWVQSTGAIGIEVKRGRTGGINAHQDIALEFCTWRSPVFKLYVLKEFERLKELEQHRLDPEWTVRRVLAANNWRIQTDAVRDYELPRRNMPESKEGIVYAEEAETLNLALFHITSKQWKIENPTLALQEKNLRDYANINELIVLSNLEGLNALLIKENNPREERIKYLTDVAKHQLKSLSTADTRKSMVAQQKKDQLRAAAKPATEFDAGLKGLMAVPPPPKKIRGKKKPE